MGKNLLWTFDEELALPVLGRLEERGGNRPCFCAPDQLFRGSPVWAAAVEGIQNDVAACFGVEAFDEFTGWVVDDRRVPPCLDLAEHLHDDCGLAAAGIPDDLEVLVFGAFGHAEKTPAFVDLDPDSGPLDCFVELRGCDQNWPLQTPAVLHFLPSPDVPGNRPWELQEEKGRSKDQLQSEDPGKGLAAKNLLAQVLLDAGAGEGEWRAAVKEDHASLSCGIGQLKGNRFPGRLRCRSGFDVNVARVPHMTLRIRHEQHAVLRMERKRCRGLAFDVRGQVKLLERRQCKKEPEVQKEPGCDQPEKQRAEGVDRFVRGPDDGLFAAPGDFRHDAPPRLRSCTAPGLRLRAFAESALERSRKCKLLKPNKALWGAPERSAAPYEGWIVEIQPVRSTERASSGTGGAFGSGLGRVSTPRMGAFPLATGSAPALRTRRDGATFPDCEDFR